MKEEERRKEQQTAREWVRQLSMPEVFELGDALVLGTFDWTEWLPRWGIEHKPSSAFLRAADQECILREEVGK